MYDELKEAEESQSPFHQKSDEVLMPSDQFFNSWPEPCYFADPSPEENFWRKMAAIFYGGIDKLFDVQSIIPHREEEVSIPQPYKRILEFLHKEGVVSRALMKEGRFNDAPHFNYFAIYGKHPDGITDGLKDINLYGLIFQKGWEDFFSKALGEFLERYFMTIYKKRGLVGASPRELKKGGIAYLNLKIAGNLGYDFTDSHQRPWNEDDIFFWEKARRLSTGEVTYVPAQLVYWNYLLNEAPPEPRLQESNTNGAGGMFTEEGAILSALYELIQRDAFFVHWLLAISPPKIDPDSVPDETFQLILEESRRYGFDIHCLNTTLDTEIPSFNVVLIDNSGKGPYFAIGGGCEADPAKAIRHAAEEAWGINYWMRWDGALEKNFRLPDDYRPFSDPNIDQKNRGRLWSRPAMTPYGEFFLSGNMRKLDEHIFSYPLSFSSKKAELKEAVSRIETLGTGYEVYTVSVRHQILKKLGYYVSRAVVPKFVPLYLCEHHAPINAVRIQEMAQKLGRQNHSLNTFPHPFA